MNRRIVPTCVSLALTGVASAGPTIVSLTYGDLSGNYTATNATSGTFMARAVDIPGVLRSAGTDSRLEGALGTADFQPGFVSGADLADFVMTLSVTHTATTGTGSGSFTATDADGDTITGLLNGTWSLQGTFIAFEGTMSNVLIHDNGTQDHTFNGSNTGSWDTNFASGGPYNGAIVKLTENAGNFFTSNFSDQATGVTAQITTFTAPLPAGVSAGGLTLGGVLGLRSRRRR
jgi:hypothetical protein